MDGVAACVHNFAGDKIIKDVAVAPGIGAFRPGHACKSATGVSGRHLSLVDHTGLHQIAIVFGVADILGPTLPGQRLLQKAGRIATAPQIAHRLRAIGSRSLLFILLRHDGCRYQQEEDQICIS